MARVSERALRADELKEGMVIRRWGDIKGPVNRGVIADPWPDGEMVRVFLTGRHTPLVLQRDSIVVVRRYPRSEWA